MIAPAVHILPSAAVTTGVGWCSRSISLTISVVSIAEHNTLPSSESALTNFPMLYLHYMNHADEMLLFSCAEHKLVALCALFPVGEVFPDLQDLKPAF